MRNGLGLNVLNSMSIHALTGFVILSIIGLSIEASKIEIGIGIILLFWYFFSGVQQIFLRSKHRRQIFSPL